MSATPATRARARHDTRLYRQELDMAEATMPAPARSSSRPLADDAAVEPPARAAEPEGQSSNAPATPYIAHRAAARTAARSLDGLMDRERRRKAKALTADSVANKTCFICYANEAEEAAAPRKWTHACHCSLMAHESCLLTWIDEAQHRSSDNKPVAQRAVKCPQCATPYKVRQATSATLNVIEAVERYFNRLAVHAAFCTLGVGIVASSATYGYLATRLFVGPQLAAHLFDRCAHWPLSYYLNLPFVAPLLILSRTDLMDGLLSIAPLTLFTSPDQRRELVAVEHGTLWPPSAHLTLCLLPWARVLYRRLRKRVWKLALGLVPGPGLVHGPAHPRLLVLHEGQPAANAEPVADVAPNALAAPAVLAEPHVSLCISGIARLALGALLWPAMSAVAGRTLLWLVTPAHAHPLLLSAAKASALRSFLGLGRPDVLRVALGYRPVELASESIGITGWLGKSLGLTSPVAASPTVPLDPAWWRNAIGGGLLVLVKDMGALLRAVLERRRLGSRRVQAVPVDPSLELELR